MRRFLGEEAFYYCHDNKGVLEGMVSNYVDDFILTGQEEFVKNITEKLKKKLDISKMKEGAFRITGIDVQKVLIKMEVGKNDFTDSLDVVNVKDCKQDEMLTKEETKIFRNNSGN